MYRKCEFCGKYFEPNTTFQKYCSRSCKDKAFYLKRKSRASPPPPPIKKICAVCGAEFIPVKYNRNHQKYCSFNCAWEVRKAAQCARYRKRKMLNGNKDVYKMQEGIFGDARAAEVLQ